MIALTAKLSPRRREELCAEDEHGWHDGQGAEGLSAWMGGWAAVVAEWEEREARESVAGVSW